MSDVSVLFMCEDKQCRVVVVEVFKGFDEDLVVTIKCHHSGKFQKKEAVVDYVDGEVTVVKNI
ncbi:unnamed protein product [Eruca vesicaria subsp. sativa]|uniref:Uncharacterized protein n=1 Tax=Eruca vesicaria subsp. sativa TaxID=29727 RepID=A0ABC8KMC6_ERUVS|nr:unnamed protein product [Eruca vesicaria subsp. sativa]